ncbi:site-specific integrase [Nocardioides zhouii]|uniref:Site-specific integrase n=2 Tax=Nocardioides zhouii TaxID=1168729 RepID=A0A4Q2T3A3_9ACTN|nr:site-specific integrase [Nocardioides zhouii]
MPAGRPPGSDDLTLPRSAERLMERASAYAAATRSPATLKAYASDWAHFEEWTGRHGASALPAEPVAVAMYVTDLATTHKPGTLTRRLAAISVMHQRHGLTSPTVDPRVREILRGVRRTEGVAARRASPLGLGELRRMIAHLPDTTAGSRDRAILLVGFAGALRRSELVALRVDDVEWRDEGAVLHIRRSKADQEAAGREVALPRGKDEQSCPVDALRSWLAEGDISRGQLFRSVDRHGNVGEQLSDRAIVLVIRRAATAAGLDPDKYSGHSLRAGFATTAAAHGASERRIAVQTGHRSMEVLRGYIRHATVFTDNAVNDLGL